ncbi:MAG: hypothetical protein IPH88_18620 [Bacteroidales bacterium]|nr:hypothetical protein [Bacteroidales bacterium]
MPDHSKSLCHAREIASALQGVDVMVLVKNPINPELELWSRTIERKMKSGVAKVGGYSEGFSTCEKQPTATNPDGR